MLYDQARLADDCPDGFLLTGDETYGWIARETFAYLLRDIKVVTAWIPRRC